MSKITNIPDILDTRAALAIIESMGARIERSGKVTVIDSRNMEYSEREMGMVCRLRASTYLIGSCLSRFSIAPIANFGGCNFSPRPIDLHVCAAKDFGAVEERGHLLAGELRGTDIHLAKRSVGATVNSLMLATGAKGQSRIFGGASEPHIMTLIDFLRSMGADIRLSENCITVSAEELTGGEVEIPGDMIEAGSFLALSAMTGGKLETSGFCKEELKVFFSTVTEGGIQLEMTEAGAILGGRATQPMEVVAAPYPAFPTDLQPILASLMATGSGGVIYDRVFPGRFGYLDQLARLGLKYERTADGARIYPSEIKCGTANAVDLRGGAAAILLALCAKGESVIESGETVLRGYENLTGKLKSIGAEIDYRE